MVLIKCILVITSTLIFTSYELKSEICNDHKVEEIKKYFSLREEPEVKKIEKKESGKYYNSYEGVIETSQNAISVEFEFYESIGMPNESDYPLLEDGKRPIVFLFPGFNGRGFVDRFIAKFYAKNGVHVVISDFRNKQSEKKPHFISKTILENVEAGIAIIDHFQKAVIVDENRMALFAYSFGGIRATFLACIDDRIKAYNLIATGGDFNKILYSSELSEIKKLNELFMKELSISSNEEYQKYLENSMPFFPAKTLSKEESKRFYFVISSRDIVVPGEYQASFANSFINPQIETYHYLGHIPAIMSHIFRNLNLSLKFYESVWYESDQ